MGRSTGADLMRGRQYFTFTGRRHDGSTQLIQMGARWYNGRIGRWVSADTIVPDPADPQSLSRFSYVTGNPLRYIDPTGTQGRPPKPKLDWFKFDWAGVLILGRYLNGMPDLTIVDRPLWTRYMQSNQILQEDVLSRIGDIARDLQSQGDIDTALIVHERFHAEMENGESIIGYQYLHGTNFDVGDFEIEGYGTVSSMSRGYQIVELELTFTWHDRIDPNLIYKTDKFKFQIAELLTEGVADPYDIHISWTEHITVWIDEDGNPVYITGWPNETDD